METRCGQEVGSAPALPVLGHEQAHDARIELAARAGLELGQGLVRRAVLAVRRDPGHGVERVRDRDDARAHRDLFALLAARVAATVPALVVGVDDGQDVLPERDRLQELHAESGMAPRGSCALRARAAPWRSTAGSSIILPMSWSREA